jgi:hypothetical protein
LARRLSLSQAGRSSPSRHAAIRIPTPPLPADRIANGPKTHCAGFCAGGSRFSWRHLRYLRDRLGPLGMRERPETLIGGAGGIRTLDRALQPYNGLANRRLQPLGHSSVTADMPEAAAGRKRADLGPANSSSFSDDRTPYSGSKRILPLNLSLGRGPLAPRAGGLRIRATRAFRIFIDIMLVRHFDGGAVLDSRARESLRGVSRKCDWHFARY